MNKEKTNRLVRCGVGVIVAFQYYDKGEIRYKSGKVIRIFNDEKRVIIETEYGFGFKVDFDDIIWVKTGKRWPRGVYNLLKGIEKNEKTKEENKD